MEQSGSKSVSSPSKQAGGNVWGSRIHTRVCKCGRQTVWGAHLSLLPALGISHGGGGLGWQSEGSSWLLLLGKGQLHIFSSNKWSFNPSLSQGVNNMQSMPKRVLCGRQENAREVRAQGVPCAARMWGARGVS